VLRELGYGVLFYMSAISGAVICGTLWSNGISHGPEENAEWLVEGAIGGALIGSAAWLYFKYNPATEWLRYALLFGMSAAVCMVVLIAVRVVFDVQKPFAAVSSGAVAWLGLVRLMPTPHSKP
jgi:hypothetical protein